MFQAAIFDMDGLLLDSEPFWQDAQLAIFTQLGVPITREDTLKTTGIRIDQIVEYYFTLHPWQGPSKKDVCEKIIDCVIELVTVHKPIKPGVHHAIALCKKANLRIALASSSPLRLINATLNALELNDYFEICHSAEHLKYGKPHPEVYINTAQHLGVKPQHCIAFEDSFAGLLAAKSAQMHCVVIPEISAASQPHWIISDCKLNSLNELTAQHLLCHNNQKDNLSDPLNELEK